MFIFQKNDSNCIAEEPKIILDQNCQVQRIVIENNLECISTIDTNSPPDTNVCKNVQQNDLLTLKTSIEESIQSLEDSNFFTNETESDKEQKNIEKNAQKVCCILQSKHKII